MHAKDELWIPRKIEETVRNIKNSIFFLNGAVEEGKKCRLRAKR